MYHVIMVPVDGSEFSRHAIPWALTVARPAGATVRLVNVLVPPYVMGMANGMVVAPNVIQEQRTAQAAAMDDLASRLSTGTGSLFVGAVEEGEPVSVLLGYAKTHGVDLVVMSTHGRGGLGRAVLGSVSDAVVRKGDLPVLLVRPHEHVPEEREPMAVSDVLILLDGSPASETILDHAIELSELTGAACVLLHVGVPVLPATMAPSEAIVDPDALRENGVAAESYLKGLADRFRTRNVPVTARVVRGMDAASEILAYCASHPVSLIAMTTRRRGALERALLGSMASTLLRRTTLPILVIRAKNPVADNDPGHRLAN
jgi:nucleotide-binding universal stress UspA family protein